MIDWNKPIETTSGLRAQYIVKLNHPRFPHVCSVITNAGSQEYIYQFDSNGKPLCGAVVALRNIPEPSPEPSKAREFQLLYVGFGEYEILRQPPCSPAIVEPQIFKAREVLPGEVVLSAEDAARWALFEKFRERDGFPWIKCSDRLPADNLLAYAVLCERCGYKEMRKFTGKGLNDKVIREAFGVVYWMYLPSGSEFE